MTVSTAQPGPLIWKSHFTARPACRTRARPGLATAPPPPGLQATGSAVGSRAPEAGNAVTPPDAGPRLWALAVLGPGKKLGGEASGSVNNPAPSCTLQTRPQGFTLLLWEGFAPTHLMPQRSWRAGEEPGLGGEGAPEPGVQGRGSLLRRDRDELRSQ